MRQTLFLLLLLTLRPAIAQNYAGEVYLLGYSVANNGTSGILPSYINSPSQSAVFPSVFGVPSWSLETSTLPLFGGLAEAVSGAARIPLDSNTEVVFFGAIITDKGIQERPKLQGTAEQRALDPSQRPSLCTSCRSLTNVDYPAILNIKRRFNFFLPRLDFSSTLIPLSLGMGINTKYFKSELEGDADEYIAQNINLDAGAHITMDWGLDTKTKKIERSFTIDVSGFELLQTSQVSEFAQEPIESRYHLAFYWDEYLPMLKSRARWGVHQRSEWSKWPGIGMEWELLKILYLRSGLDTQILSGGASLKYRFLAVHYSFSMQDLATNPYQFSLEVYPFRFFD